jgi:predicted O-methyltransferase YrrM
MSMNESISFVLGELERIRDEQGNPFWNLSRESAMFMSILVRILDAKKVLEIGTSNGLSGLVMAEALVDTGGHLWTIESHDERFGLARENFEKAGVLGSVVTQVKGHAPEDIPRDIGGDDGLDLVLMDATKMEAIRHFEAVKPLCRRGAVVVTDNIHSHKEEGLGWGCW